MFILYCNKYTTYYLNKLWSISGVISGPMKLPLSSGDTAQQPLSAPVWHPQGGAIAALQEIHMCIAI